MTAILGQTLRGHRRGAGDAASGIAAMIKNGKITSTMLGIEDHGIMTFFLTVQWPGSGCSFGGYSLDAYGGEGEPRRSSGVGYQAIRRILETLGVDRWEKLPGTLIRLEDEGPGGRLTKIGHIMEERWFDLAEYMKAAGAEA